MIKLVHDVTMGKHVRRKFSGLLGGPFLGSPLLLLGQLDPPPYPPKGDHCVPMLATSKGHLVEMPLVSL